MDDPVIIQVGYHPKTIYIFTVENGETGFFNKFKNR
jgi:hypothetical protein